MSAGGDFRALVATGRVHFMGVGGAGMCALAELLARSGADVSGCDAKDSRALRDLAEQGVAVSVGHDAAHAAGIAMLVATAAAPADHPEILAARSRGVPVVKRATALGEWIKGGKTVAISGSHGKTTTTAMTTQVLDEAGLDPTGLVGGRVPAWGGNLRMGSDALFVVEADEYDRSFLALSPDVAVVTNLEADHLEIYGDFEGVRTGFLDFLRRVRPGGRVIACADDHGAASLLAQLDAPVVTYGLAAGSMLRAVNVEVGDGTTRFSVVEEGRPAGDVTIRAGGAHNVRNALAAAAVARTLGVEWSTIAKALASFTGVGRRFEHVGEAQGVTVIDDYAHHPTEVAATLAAARALFPDARLVVAFQPHLYSRTRDFVDAFGRELAEADVLWVTDVFPAREAPIPGIDGSIVAEAARDAGAAEVHFHADLTSLSRALAAELHGGDVLLTLGAGSIESLGYAVLGRLTGHHHLYGRRGQAEQAEPWQHGQPPSFGGHGHA